MSNQYPEIRPTIVNALLHAEPYSEEKERLLEEATDAEQKEAIGKLAGAHAVAALKDLMAAGVLKQTSILDADFLTLYALSWVLKNLYTEWAVWPKSKNKKLGDMLKTADPKIAADCMWWLRRAGLLPEETSSHWEDDNGRLDPPSQSE